MKIEGSDTFPLETFFTETFPEWACFFRQNLQDLARARHRFGWGKNAMGATIIGQPSLPNLQLYWCTHRPNTLLHLKVQTLLVWATLLPEHQKASPHESHLALPGFHVSGNRTFQAGYRWVQACVCQNLCSPVWLAFLGRATIQDTRLQPCCRMDPPCFILECYP